MPEPKVEPVVKISWKEHNRTYQVGIKQLFAKLGLDVTDEEIKIAIYKILSEL